MGICRQEVHLNDLVNDYTTINKVFGFSTDKYFLVSHNKLEWKYLFFK